MRVRVRVGLGIELGQGLGLRLARPSPSSATRTRHEQSESDAEEAVRAEDARHAEVGGGGDEVRRGHLQAEARHERARPAQPNVRRVSGAARVQLAIEVCVRGGSRSAAACRASAMAACCITVSPPLDSK